MKLDKLATLTLIVGLVAGGATAGISAPAQAAPQWRQTEKVCQEKTAGKVCLEQRRNTRTGGLQFRMVLAPNRGQWIRPEVHSAFGWDFGTEIGACGQEGCAKETKPMTGAWVDQGRNSINGLGYSTPQGRFDIYIGRTKQQRIKSSGWRAEDPGRAAVRVLVKLKNNKVHYTGRLRLKSVDLMSLQPRRLKIELLRSGEVKASSSKKYTGETEEIDWTSDVTQRVRMPSKGFDAIRVTGTYETAYGQRHSVRTTYTHGR